MSIEVREMLNDDALAFLQVHHAAVRGIAAKDYPPEVVEDWAPMPITNQSIERFLTNPDGELRLVAEIDGRIVGIGALVLAKSELRACYVAPQAARDGQHPVRHYGRLLAVVAPPRAIQASVRRSPRLRLSSVVRAPAGRPVT